MPAATDLKGQAHELRKALDAKKVEAQQRWATFEEAKTSAIAEGADLSADGDAFKKLDEAGKSYDALRDEIAAGEAKWGRLVELAHLDAGDDPGEPGGKANPFDPSGGDGRPAPRKSIGTRFVESEQYKALVKSGRLDLHDIPMGNTDSFKVADVAELKTLVTGGVGGTSGGAFLVPDRQSGLVELPRRPVAVSDLVAVSETISTTVEWVEQTSRTNAAAETAEAGATGDGSGAAPESAVAYAVRSSIVQDITHFIPATKKALSDVGQLAGLLDNELVDGVRERLDTQMISGNGTTPNLRGILNTASLPTQARGTDSRSDATHKAITLIRLAFFEPDTLLVHPTDWESIRLEKDSTGEYIYGPPSAPDPASIWGLRAVVNPVIAQGTPIVGNFRRGATLWLHEGLSVAASDSHSDFFVRRMVAMLAVIRVAFAVQRVKCFTELTGF